MQCIDCDNKAEFRSMDGKIRCANCEGIWTDGYTFASRRPPRLQRRNPKQISQSDITD